MRLALVALVGCALLPAVAAPAAAAGSATESTYLVSFAPGTSPQTGAAAVRAGGGQVDRVLEHVFSGNVVRMSRAQAAALAGNPRVSRVEPDQVVHADGTQNPAPWGLDRIDQRALPLNGSFTSASTGVGVTAYVVDSGIRADHVDFEGRVSPGFNVVNDLNGTSDCNGHGTHVAGTIGGHTYGVAKAVQLVPVRVLDCQGAGTTSGIVAALDWIIAQHQPGAPAVANLSLGGDASTALDNAVQATIADGVTVVVAAGNSSADACSTSPSRVPAALTVGATDSTDARASFSDFGSCLDLFAPGVAITSDSNTSPYATAVKSGTSMAAPYVSGAAADLLQVDPVLSPEALAEQLRSTASSVVTSAGTGSPNLLVWANPAPVAHETLTLLVTRIYSDLFHRPPDLAGLDHWCALLAQGQPPSVVADAITSSAEYRSGLIRQAYTDYLLRTPRQDEVDGWLAAFGAGTTPAQLEAGFAASPEFSNRFGATDAAWVGALYQSVLGRSASAGEVAAWQASLTAGNNRYAVALGFTLSAEHLTTVLNGLYQSLLGRTLDPVGQATWIRLLQGPARLEQVVGGIISSPEYIARQ